MALGGLSDDELELRLCLPTSNLAERSEEELSVPLDLLLGSRRSEDDLELVLFC